MSAWSEPPDVVTEPDSGRARAVDDNAGGGLSDSDLLALMVGQVFRLDSCRASGARPAIHNRLREDNA